MDYLSNRVKELSESETLAMTRLSRELSAKGHNVINLSIGQPDFFTPDYIKQAAKKAIDDNFTFYPPVAGFNDLKETISLKFKRDNGLDYAPNQIVVSSGAKQSISNAILCLVNPGDEVIVPAPYWVSYREMIKLAGGVPVFIKTSIKDDYKITPEQLKPAITKKTKLFIYSSPCNPSGSVYTKEELRQIATVLAEHEVFIISDEIYELINFKGKHESIAQFDFIKDKVITINGVSKGFSMTGWRLGFMGANPEIASACNKLQGQMTSGASTISQKAALKALSQDPGESADLKKMLSAFRERRDLVVESLEDTPGFKTNKPDGAFYVFPDISELYGMRNGDTIIKDSNDFCNYILQKVFVALVPGTAFGNPECIRLSYATSKELLVEAIIRINNAIAELS